MGRISRRVLMEHSLLLSGWSAVATAWGDGNRRNQRGFGCSRSYYGGGWSQLAYTGLKNSGPARILDGLCGEHQHCPMDQVARGLGRRFRPDHRATAWNFSSTLLEVRPIIPATLFRHHFPPQSEVTPQHHVVNMGYFGAAYGPAFWLR